MTSSFAAEPTEACASAVMTAGQGRSWLTPKASSSAALPPVIEVAPHTYLAASKTAPGDFHSVVFEPRVRVSCSCIKGRFVANRGSNPAFERDVCSHVRAVIDWLRDQIEASR